MAGMKNALEDHWMDEEDALRKRGIDPMTVDQIVPPKLPTHKHGSTLHRGKKARVKGYAKGGVVQGFDVPVSDWRRNKARELNEGAGDTTKRMIKGMGSSNVYAKK